LIDARDVVGLSIVMLQVLYMNSEFVRIGYWVNSEYRDEALKENPPLNPQIEALFKNILATKPRVTRFHINWCAIYYFLRHGLASPTPMDAIGLILTHCMDTGSNLRPHFTLETCLEMGKAI
jgi:uncharacterized protein YneF (UPF0154 family)